MLRIGALTNTDFVLPSQEPLNWTSEAIKVLGIIITPHPTSTATLNYKEILSKSKKKLALWSDRSMSLVGKIQIYNSLVSSLNVNRMMALPSPDKEKFYKEAKNDLIQFLWDGKPTKIKYKKLIQKYKNTGLNCVI